MPCQAKQSLINHSASPTPFPFLSSISSQRMQLLLGHVQGLSIQDERVGVSAAEPRDQWVWAAESN